MTYAADTSVSVEKSRAEIESILGRYGASRFGYMTDENKAIVVFEANKKAVKFELPLPDKTDRRFTECVRRGYYTGKKRSPEDAHKLWEQACRSRWRSLCLCIKAKLDMVSTNISSFEIEFLPHFVMPNGKTIGEQMVPQLEAMANNGTMPRLQLTPGTVDV